MSRVEQSWKGWAVAAKNGLECLVALSMSTCATARLPAATHHHGALSKLTQTIPLRTAVCGLPALSDNTTQQENLSFPLLLCFWATPPSERPKGVHHDPGVRCWGALDMPLASGREAGAQEQWTPHQRPLSNTRPPPELSRNVLRPARGSVGPCSV